MAEISGTKKRVLDVIRHYQALNGYPPTIREIAEKLELKSTKAVFVHLKDLEQDGYIKRSKKARAIEILPQYVNIPIMGVISAGKPLLAQEYMEQIYHIPKEEGIGRFFLKIHGDSMVEAGLNNGDMVLVDKNQSAKSGDIIVAVINGEATVKRFIKKGNTFLLKPENKYYDPITINTEEDEFEIVGIVVGHLTLF